MRVQSPMDCSVTLPKQPQAISETKPLGARACLSCLLRCLRRGFLNLVLPPTSSSLKHPYLGA